ncbi:hypothetical protein K438DRAFT_1752771 [Mycena galopus ATCC 62051]|nr:hypothetical protein K438DRAFT_1752771 [Mycena galopus ATCC 62051]
MTSAKTIPQLPVELIAEIISTAWHMPLSQPERITLMRSSVLVNSTWADIFDLISSRDVYIPSAAFCDHFIHRLRRQPPAAATLSVFGRFVGLFSSPVKSPVQMARSVNLLCQSLTIQITNDDVHPPRSRPMRLPMGGVLDSLLETLDAWSLAPNMRRLSIEYVDTGFDDIFSRGGLAAIPLQTTHLDLRYSFSDAMPTWLVKSLKENQERQRHLRWKAEGIARLSVVGAGENTIRDLMVACPNVQILDRECISR